MMRAYAIWGQGRNVLIFLVALNLVRIRSTYIQLLVVIINIIQGVIIPDIILLQRSLKSLVCQFKCSYFGFAQRGKANIHDLHCSHALTVPYSSSLCPCLC